MAPQHALLLILSVSSLLISAHGRHVRVQAAVMNAPVDPAVQGVCAKSDNVDLCVSSVAPFLNGRTDPTSILIEEVHATSRAAEDALKQAKSIEKKGNDDVVSTCVDNFDSAVDDLKKALDAIMAHDTNTADTMLSGVLTYATTCEDSYKEMGGNSPFVQLDDTIQKLASNCLAIRQAFLV